MYKLTFSEDWTRTKKIVKLKYFIIFAFSIEISNILLKGIPKLKYKNILNTIVNIISKMHVFTLQQFIKTVSQ